VAYDFSLKRAVIEVDRDADRRWSFATDKMKLAEDKDEVAPNSAPLEDVRGPLCHKISLPQCHKPPTLKGLYHTFPLLGMILLWVYHIA